MRRYGPATTMTYSFGPGPMTPAVKAIIWANIAFFALSLLFQDQIIHYLGLTPGAVLERGWIWQPARRLWPRDTFATPPRNERTHERR